MIRRASAIASQWFARAVRAMSARRRQRLAGSPLRRPLAALIFLGMVRAYDPARGAGLEAVVRWHVGDDPPRDVAIAGGRCRRVRGRGLAPDATLRLDHLALLELATGLAQGPQLYITGRLRVEGSIMLAQRLTAAFDVPAAPSS